MNRTIAAVTKHIAGLDHLRALAITMVFIFHYRLFPHPAWIDTVCGFGWTGVDLFFVLSGYLITNQIFYQVKKEQFSWTTFFIKRTFRILPAYWVVLALYFLVPFFREWESLAPLWKYLTFTQNFNLDRRFSKTFSHVWSLCVEEQFYLLLPITLILFNYLQIGRKAGYLIVSLFITGFLIRIYSWDRFIVPVIGTEDFGFNWYKWIYYPTYNRLDGLLVGISVAGIKNYHHNISAFLSRHSNLLFFTGLGILSSCYFLCLDPYTFNASIFGFPLVAIGYGFLVTAAAVPGSLINRRYSKITSVLATLSYSIYLTHKAIIHITQALFSIWGLSTNSSWMFITSAATSCLAAAVLYILIEKPFLKIKDNILHRYLKTGQRSN